MFDLRTIKRLMKPSLRQPKLVALVRNYLMRGKAISDEFGTLKTEADERRLYNSQTLSLQEYLRVKFSDNSIVVLNQADEVEKQYIFWLNENQSQQYIKFMSEAGTPTYVHFLSEFDDSSLNYDFCVECPLSLQPFEDDIAAVIKVMKLAGKRYKITFV